MNLESQAGDVAIAGVKITPPLAVTGAAVLDISLQDWVLIATLAYTVLQIGLLIYDRLKRRADADE